VSILILRFQDYGIVLRIIPFEEAKYIITVLTKQNGIYQGMTDQSIPIWTHMNGHWSSRTQTLGYWACEEVSCLQYTDYQMLLSLQTLSSLLCHVLPSRHPYSAIYEALLLYKDIAQFSDLLFLILEEIGYGVGIPSTADPKEKVQLALNLFTKHCGWKRVLS
jgi:recombinational DNA repair protein (RecF pathway)